MKYKIAVNPRMAPTGMGILASSIAHDGLPNACEIIHSRRNVVARMEHEHLILKSYKKLGLVKGLIYRYLRTPKCHRAYNNALKLRSLSIKTPEPAFSIECYKPFTGLKNSYYACVDYNDWSELRGVEKREDFSQIANALARFIFDIHTKGVWMKDMSPGNVLFIQKPEGGYDFALVDINRMEFNVREWSKLLRNFQALLDTEDGTAAVAQEYLNILSENHITLHIVDFVAWVRKRYRKYFKSKMRHKKLKKLFSRKHHHHHHHRY